MAYPNTVINDTGYGTYQSDTATAVTLGLYIRCKFSTTADTSNSGKPTLLVAGVTDRGNVITQQTIAAGAWGTVRFLTAQGIQFGIASGTIGVGAPVYTAANGQYSATQGSGLLAGYAVTAGADGGAFTFEQVPAAA